MTSSRPVPLRRSPRRLATAGNQDKANIRTPTPIQQRLSFSDDATSEQEEKIPDGLRIPLLPNNTQFDGQLQLSQELTNASSDEVQATTEDSLYLYLSFRQPNMTVHFLTYIWSFSVEKLRNICKDWALKVSKSNWKALIYHMSIFILQTEAPPRGSTLDMAMVRNEKLRDYRIWLTEALEKETRWEALPSVPDLFAVLRED